MGFPGGSAGKESACIARDLGWEDPLDKGQHDYIDQMISEWKAADVTHVVFLGDVFDNERFIATDVMDYALRLFRDKLADFKVFVIAGNHDMRYTNTSDPVHILLCIK